MKGIQSVCQHSESIKLTQQRWGYEWCLLIATLNQDNSSLTISFTITTNFSLKLPKLMKWQDNEDKTQEEAAGSLDHKSRLQD